MTLPHRIGRWLDDRLVSSVAVALLGADLLYALNWLLSPPQDLRSAAYEVARMALPMNTWGAILAAVSALAVGSWAAGGRRWAVSYSVLMLAATWAFWTVLFTLGAWPLDDGASYFNSITAFVLFVLHLLVGVVIYYRDPPIPGRAGR